MYLVHAQSPFRKKTTPGLFFFFGSPLDEQPNDVVEGNSDNDNPEDYEGIVATREKRWVAPMVAPLICKITASESSATLCAGEFLDAKAKNWTRWSQSMYILFDLTKVTPYVLGAIPRPNPEEDPVSNENWVYNDTFMRMLIDTNIAPEEKMHISNCFTAHAMWTNLKSIHESTNHLMLTGHLRALVALTNQEGTNIVDHLYRLKYCWDQLRKFGDKNYRISETLFKGLIASSLPPSWDQFTNSYVAGQLDEETTDPKKLITSQEFIGIIHQEAERHDMHALGSIVFPEQLALVQSGKKSGPKPPLATQISGLITDALQSDNPLSSSKTKKKCKYSIVTAKVILYPNVVS